MKIIYKQSSDDAVFCDLGIENCYLKHLCAKSDSKTTFRKEHHHTGFEIHFMNLGHQKYVIEEEYEIKDGYVLIIPPLVKHFVADTQFYESKFSITFNKSDKSLFDGINDVVFLKANERMSNNLNTALAESKISSSFSKQITSHCVYESLLILLRMCGFKEERIISEENCEDYRLTFAKRYIKDNIESNITVLDVAAHCSLGTKQLTRLFKTYDSTTPLAYIQKQKIKHIEKLLADDYSLKEISEIMNFSSEYYFNSFYKRHSGLSPGRYKKTHIQ